MIKRAISLSASIRSFHTEHHANEQRRLLEVSGLGGFGLRALGFKGFGLQGRVSGVLVR